MSLFKLVMEDWKIALKTKSPDKEALTSIKAELQTRAKSEQVTELDDGLTIGVIGKLCEIFQETLGFAQQAQRADIIAATELKLAVARRYLPAQLSEVEVTNLIDAVIAEIGANNPKDFGKVMKVLMPQIKGKTDGAKVQEQVKTRLQ